ncbi:MAG: HAMP domain-containing histidine kinase [Desulfamplus sp.]|nr:HAMP domain-containing histidine kinase [Desulfamplus sp.]MBF0411943.1 HAMP domain-containing histidine kinase [Desulfamplus sp.]
MNGQIENLSISGLQDQYAGLQYFGAMSASIAHEIKNALAITNENAGLMEDLSLMAIKSGQSLEPERIARLAKKVMDQIKRADNIVKKMSQFAHSVDEPVKVVNLSEVTELALELGRRSAASFSITLGPVKCDGSFSIQTNPFILMNLLWLLIKSAFRRVNSDKTIEVVVSKEGSKVSIAILNLLKNQLDSEQDKAQNDQIAKLADLLNADVYMNNTDKIVINIMQNNKLK